MPSYSVVPDDFLRSMLDATEAFKELNAAAAESAKQREKENKDAARGGAAGKLGSVLGQLIPLSAVGLLGSGLRGGSQAFFNGGSAGAGFTAGIMNAARGVTGFNQNEQNALGSAVDRVRSFVQPLAESGAGFSSADLEQMVRSELGFTSRMVEPNKALSNTQTKIQNEIDARAMGPALDSIANALQVAADAQKMAEGYVRQLSTSVGEHKGFNIGKWHEGGGIERGGSPR